MKKLLCYLSILSCLLLAGCHAGKEAASVEEEPIEAELQTMDIVEETTATETELAESEEKKLPGIYNPQDYDTIEDEFYGIRYVLGVSNFYSGKGRFNQFFFDHERAMVNLYILLQDKYADTKFYYNFDCMDGKFQSDQSNPITEGGFQFTTFPTNTLDTTALLKDGIVYRFQVLLYPGIYDFNFWDHYNILRPDYTGYGAGELNAIRLEDSTQTNIYLIYGEWPWPKEHLEEYIAFAKEEDANTQDDMVGNHCVFKFYSANELKVEEEDLPQKEEPAEQETNITFEGQIDAIDYSGSVTFLQNNENGIYALQAGIKTIYVEIADDAQMKFLSFSENSDGDGYIIIPGADFKNMEYGPDKSYNGNHLYDFLGNFQGKVTIQNGVLVSFEQAFLS